MFYIRKIFDREWRHRKKMMALRHIITKDIIERIELKHTISNVYWFTFGSKLHWRNPKTFNEKLIWLSYYWQNPLVVRCADKYQMREYVTNTCGLPESLLVPLIGVYQKPEDIDYSILPSSFVLKCNHGCGYNIIVPNRANLDVDYANSQLNLWLSEKYKGGVSETHYLKICPHVVICERFLPALSGGSIIDYKIHCFNGIPDFVLVCYDRDKEGTAKFATFDSDWNQLYYVINEENVKIEKPKSLDRMYEYSTILSKAFPFVRVDFYDVDGNPYLGEMTFTPYGNMIDYYKNDVQISLGNKLILPKPYKG